MISLILSFLTGVIGPLLPEVLKLFRESGDRAHEIAMMRLRLEAGAMEHGWRMEEINAQADIAEAVELHKPAQSFGVQLLDAAKPYATQTWGKWLITPCFYLFALLDFASGMVRPVVAYAAFSFYIAYKVALYNVAIESRGTYEAVIATWGENDWAVLLLVLGFYFGQRMVKAAFGGSSQTSYRNG